MVLSEFNPPWFEGQAMASDVPALWPVAIAGHGYLIEPKLYQRSFVPVQRDARDDNIEPGEQTLSPAGLWRRSQSDWSLGAGQTWLDEEDSTRHRFRESLGIDVFTERQATLLPVTEEKRTSANSNLRLLVAGNRLYAVDGANLIFSNGTSSEQNATWVTGWTTATGLPGGNILDIACSGSLVFVLGSDNTIYSATIGTTAFGVYYNPAVTVPTRIWMALGRLFMSALNVLYEVNATPGEAVVFTHPDPAFRWTSLVGTPTGVYAAGNSGQNGEIRRTIVNAAGTGWDVPVVAAEFRNEQVQALASAGQNLLIGTTLGFRYSALSDQTAGLDFGPVVSAVGSVQGFMVDSVNAETFVWFTWSNIESGISGTGRIRLARFAEPKVPAYASDIYSAAGGTSIAVASINGRRYFAISADGFYGATQNFVASGTLSTGRIRYGMLDMKVFADLQWRTAPLPSDARVYATFISDTDQTVTTSAQESTASTASAVNNLGPVFAEWGEITFTLERGGVVTNALLLTGISGDDATTPDHASFDTDDINIRMVLSPDSWVPGGFGRILADQAPGGGDNAWDFVLAADGKLTWIWSTDGTNGFSASTTAALGFLDGTVRGVGVAFDANNGAGGRTITFETSEDGVTWTTLETVIQATATSIFNSTASVGISRLLPFDGYVLSMEIRNGPTPGSGTVIANPNFSAQPAGTTSFADTAAVPKTWTINNDAEIGLVAGSDAEAPTLRAWILRSIPSPQVTQRFLVPIKLAHKLQPPHGPVRGLHSDAELEFLASLVASQAIVSYQEGRKSFSVHVLNYEVRGTDWDKTAHHMETIVMVEMLSL